MMVISDSERSDACIDFKMYVCFFIFDDTFSIRKNVQLWYTFLVEN